jgi:hypothetical protein
MFLLVQCTERDLLDVFNISLVRLTSFLFLTFPAFGLPFLPAKPADDKEYDGPAGISAQLISLKVSWSFGGALLFAFRRRSRLRLQFAPAFS